MNILAPLLADGYKPGHHLQYPEGTSLIYSNFTPRANKYGPKDSTGVVVVGIQMFIRWLDDTFNQQFFALPEDEAISTIETELSLYLNAPYDASHFRALHRLGYLPILIKALPEGTIAPFKVPVLTIQSTHKDFHWVEGYLESIMSNMLWQGMTSATIALAYRRILTKYCLETNPEAIEFVNWQAHDFSMRGLSGDTAAVLSGIGHASVFLGSDSLPVIWAARKYYDAKGFIIGSVNATEHSVMCAGGKENELDTYRRLITKVHPTGIVSIVSDTWDLWNVLTNILVELKDTILARDGKVVIRPDSGDPVDIICGTATVVRVLDDSDGPALVLYDDSYYRRQWERISNHYSEPYYEKLISSEVKSAEKGVIELLWDVFGGTVNAQGYKVLDPHVGAIYGDSITPARAIEICERLKAKGFASTNIVFGVGSFTYQYNTRDTFGFAMKATYCEVLQPSIAFPGEVALEARDIFKDPVTDDGTKKSARGLLQVYRVQGAHGTSNYQLKDQCTWEQEAEGDLIPVYNDGQFHNQITLETLRERIKQL